MNNATNPDQSHVNPAPEAHATPPAPETNPPADAAPANASEPSPESRPDEFGRPPMTPEMKKAAGEIFDPNSTFETLGLRSSVLKGVQTAGFT